MKKILLFCLSIFSCFLLVGCNKEITITPLEEKYYGHSEILELNIQTFESLIEEKETFGMLIYQPMCAASSNFENVLKEFTKKQQITLYKMQFIDMKETNLNKHIEYCPSFVIFQNGKMVDFLDANSDDDVDYYLSSNGFETWFSTYIELRTPEYIEEEFVKEVQDDIDNTFDIEIDNLVYDENKINIYFFYGNECIHCEHEQEFFNSIEEDYGDLYVLHSFEVWHDESNEKIYREFLKVMGDKEEGVPYTIIGDKSFVGFADIYKEQFLEIIENKHKNSYDVYFNNKKEE